MIYHIDLMDGSDEYAGSIDLDSAVPNWKDKSRQGGETISLFQTNGGVSSIGDGLACSDGQKEPCLFLHSANLRMHIGDHGSADWHNYNDDSIVKDWKWIVVDR